MRLTVTSTTGFPVELSVHRGETAEGLRRLISQKLRLQTDRIIVVHKDRHLTAGALVEQGVTDGSRLTLVPVIETGSANSTKERTVMNTLESLTESQINDFLSGRLPLTLSLGAGAHTMYVQLQMTQKVRELQRNMDSIVQPRCTRQPAEMNNMDLHESSSDGSAMGFSCSKTSSPPLVSAHSTSLLQRRTHRSRTDFISSTNAAPGSCSSACTPCPLLNPAPSYSLPHAATPVCSSRPSGSEPGRLSPAPASTFVEGDVPGQLKPPGAVIDSVTSHSPGVFSGTFSGTLGPCRHGGISHPRRGIAIILQILNDLLRAACHHQGALLPPLCHLCTASKLPGSHLTAEEPCKQTNTPPISQSTERSAGDESHMLHTSEEKNKTLHSKMERLQLVMHQRRRRREIRRRLLVHGAPGRNQHRHHRS